MLWQRSSLVVVVVFLQNWLHVNSKTGDPAVPTFCYEDPTCGPDSSKWGEVCHSGHHQSPIDLPLIHGVAPTPARLYFNQGYRSDDFFIRNTGRTIEVRLGKGRTEAGMMLGDGLPTPYIFAQMHFHWGRDDRNGSGHTLNGRHFPVEVHMVHYNSMYENAEKAGASGDPRGLAVLGIFLAPGSEQMGNSAFDTISSNLPLHYQREEIHVPTPIDLRWLLPSTNYTMFRYLGSLTTPPCTEVVEWTVIVEPVIAKASELERFHYVRNEDGQFLGVNRRAVQPLGDRALYYLRTV